ncbi:MAG: Rrf2 family transcriptional regulator [Veillonella sp.]|uniref:Rrf2 family transcriptional regulator n=1 Tax=Veillonella sp. TaxID=1926307 RepID=UPI0025E34D66|nr:Rrf2 family transcriptional regulator [Veillonella sp.]MBS4912609.1 Rrf2 family transcriptional regulator [Veillonella sp.]
MQISSRFTIAIHIFVAIAISEEEHKVTSKFLASSINVNPVIIRNIVLMLKAKGLIYSRQGSSGIKIAKCPTEITLLDIFNAVESLDNGQLFNFHENPEPNCPIGRHIHDVLDERLVEIQQALEDKLRSITIASIIEDEKKLIENE